jgi:hypothetical protein
VTATTSSPTAAELLALRTAHAAVAEGPHMPYGLVDAAVLALGAAGLLADTVTVAAVEHAVRLLLAGDIERAIQRNARLHPDDQAQATLRRGMRAAQRLVGQGTTQPLTLTVYRAASGSIPLGTYLTVEAARERCLIEARDEDRFAALPASAAEWAVSEDNADVIELDLAISRGVTSATGYTVTAVPVAAAYDPEADS